MKSPKIVFNDTFTTSNIEEPAEIVQKMIHLENKIAHNPAEIKIVTIGDTIKPVQP